MSDNKESSTRPENLSKASEDQLSLREKMVIILGNILLTPLLGAILYFAWRNDYPRKAHFANRVTWIIFIAALFYGIVRGFLEAYS